MRCGLACLAALGGCTEVPELLPLWDGAWACADIAKTVIKLTNGKTILDRLILANPFLPTRLLLPVDLP